MNVVERVISVISPAWALSRSSARATLNQIESFSGANGGYEAGKLNRNTKGRLGSSIKEHAVPTAQLERLRWQSWNLWRNNSHARKIVRTLESKIVGQGMQPESQAINLDGLRCVRASCPVKRSIGSYRSAKPINFSATSLFRWHCK